MSLLSSASDAISFPRCNDTSGPSVQAEGPFSYAQVDDELRNCKTKDGQDNMTDAEVMQMRG